MLEYPFSSNIYLLGLGLVIFALVNLFLFASQYLLFKKVLKRSPTESLVFAFVGYAIQLVGTALLLGYLALLYRWTYLGLNLVIGLFLLRKSDFSWRMELPAGWHFTVGKVRQELKEHPILFTLLALAVLVIAGRTFLLALLTIPVYGDDALYHLPPIFQWINSHHITAFPTAIIYQNAYPLNADLLFLHPAIFFKLDNFILVFYSAFILSGYFFTGYAFLRFFAVKRLWSLWGALLLILNPLVINFVLTGYTDAAINLFIILAGYFFIRLVKEQKDSLLHLGFLVSLTFLLGSKYSGLTIFAFWFILYLALLTFRRLAVWRLLSLKVWLGFAALFILLGLSWYLRNYLTYGNPFAPQALTILGKEVFAGRYEPASSFDILYRGLPRTPLNNIKFDDYWVFVQLGGLSQKVKLIKEYFYTFPPHFFVANQQSLGYFWAYLGLPLALLYALFALVRRQWLLLVFLLSFGFFYLWFPSSKLLFLHSRFNSFIYIVGVVAVVMLSKELSTLKSRSLRLVGSWLLIAALILSLPPAFSLDKGNYPKALYNRARYYETGEYAAITPETSAESNLICFDYLHLYIHNARIAYIANGDYPYTYALYGKDLSNQVFYYYTLNSQEFIEKVHRDKIDLVAIVGTAHDPLSPTLAFMKETLARREAFLPLSEVIGHKGDKYDVCRDFYLYKVR